MGKYEQEFKAITEQIEASDSVSAFKDELIIAQERCDLLCQQEGAQAEILNLIQSLDQQ